MTSQSGQGSAQFGSSARRGIFACLITLAAAMMALPLGASGQIVTIRVATASNFANTARSLSAIFQESRDVRVVIVAGSTGKHYAQIVNGAPFDIFLSADEERPERLEAQGLGIKGARFIYAVGRLVLWSPRIGWFESGIEHLAEGDFHRLSIANPKLAPFGRAAFETLEALELWASNRNKIVRGENVGQAMHFVVSGGAQIGFVALSQITEANREIKAGSHWIVPEHLHGPIRQQAILLTDSPPSREFARFLQSERAKEIIEQHGYGIP